MRKKTRQVGHRRDRRKAKQSNWKRAPRRKMGTGGGCVHGETGSETTVVTRPIKRKRNTVEIVLGNYVAPLTEPLETAAEYVGPEIEEELTRIAAEVPESEWAKLPDDLTDQLDHYIYGTPKENEE